MLKRFPKILNNSPVQKFVRLDPRAGLPNLNSNLLTEGDSPVKIQIRHTEDEKIPESMPFAVIHWVCGELWDLPQFRILCGFPTYCVLAGLVQGAWSIKFDLHRSMLHIDSPFPYENRIRSSVRSYLTRKFDNRYPQSCSIHSHVLNDRAFLINTMLDFQDNKRSPLTLVDNIDNPSDQFKLLCALNQSNNVVEAKLDDGGNELDDSVELKSIRVCDIDL
eukprot:UN34584